MQMHALAVALHALIDLPNPFNRRDKSRLTLKKTCIVNPKTCLDCTCTLLIQLKFIEQIKHQLSPLIPHPRQPSTVDRPQSQLAPSTQHLAPCNRHPPPTTHHHHPPTTDHRPPTTQQPSPITYHPVPGAQHPRPTSPQPITYYPSPGTRHPAPGNRHPPPTTHDP